MGYYGFCLLTDTWMMIIIITPCFSLVAAAAALWTTTRESSVVELHSLPQVGFFYKVEPPTQAAHEMDPAKKNTFNTPLDKQWVGINFKASFLISIQSIFRYKTDSIMEFYFVKLKKEDSKVQWTVLATLQVKSGSGSCNEIWILHPFSKAAEKTWWCFSLNTEQQYWTVTVLKK